MITRSTPGLPRWLSYTHAPHAQGAHRSAASQPVAMRRNAACVRSRAVGSCARASSSTARINATLHVSRSAASDRPRRRRFPHAATMRSAPRVQWSVSAWDSSGRVRRKIPARRPTSPGVARAPPPRGPPVERGQAPPPHQVGTSGPGAASPSPPCPAPPPSPPRPSGSRPRPGRRPPARPRLVAAARRRRDPTSRCAPCPHCTGA